MCIYIYNPKSKEPAFAHRLVSKVETAKFHGLSPQQETQYRTYCIFPILGHTSMIYCWFVISQYTALTSSYVCWLMLVIPSMCWWNFRLHPSRPPVLLWEPSVASPKIRGTRATGRFSKGAGDGFPPTASEFCFVFSCMLGRFTKDQKWQKYTRSGSTYDIVYEYVMVDL